MGNQQPSTLVRLCINAKLGDGYYWCHPESKNFKLIFTSTTLELLQLKYNICPEIFGSAPKPYNGVENGKGRYANAKPMYRLASLIAPVITEYKSKTRLDALAEADITDVAMWYLDDGCFVRREYIKKDGTRTQSFRTLICIGDLCDTPEHQELFMAIMSNLFKVSTSQLGFITVNGSKGSDVNKVWHLPNPLAYKIFEVAQPWNVLTHKFPQSEGSTTIRME